MYNSNAVSMNYFVCMQTRHFELLSFTRSNSFCFSPSLIPRDCLNSVSSAVYGQFVLVFSLTQIYLPSVCL